jgi:hypothetical protein
MKHETYQAYETWAYETWAYEATHDAWKHEE